MKLFSLFLCGLTCVLTLSSCAPFKPSDKRAAICNELNSRLIFSGSTSNTRESEIQRSDRALDLRSYDANHCDEQ